MSEVSIKMSIPLDNDGFLQRECPNCERQFRVKPTSEETTEDTNTESYYCPYCYESASIDSWWTKEQIEHAQQLVFQEVIEPELQDFQRHVKALNKSSGFIQADTKFSMLSEPTLPNVSDYMVKVEFPCHQEEPLKIDKMWEQDVACLICGIRYPIMLVKTLE